MQRPPGSAAARRTGVVGRVVLKKKPSPYDASPYAVKRKVKYVRRPGGAVTQSIKKGKEGKRPKPRQRERRGDSKERARGKLGSGGRLPTLPSRGARGAGGLDPLNHGSKAPAPQRFVPRGDKADSSRLSSAPRTYKLFSGSRRGSVPRTPEKKGRAFSAPHANREGSLPPLGGVAARSAAKPAKSLKIARSSKVAKPPKPPVKVSRPVKVSKPVKPSKPGKPSRRVDSASQRRLGRNASTSKPAPPAAGGTRRRIGRGGARRTKAGKKKSHAHASVPLSLGIKSHKSSSTTDSERALHRRFEFVDSSTDTAMRARGDDGTSTASSPTTKLSIEKEMEQELRNLKAQVRDLVSRSTAAPSVNKKRSSGRKRRPASKGRAGKPRPPALRAPSVYSSVGSALSTQVQRGDRRDDEGIAQGATVGSSSADAVGSENAGDRKGDGDVKKNRRDKNTGDFEGVCQDAANSALAIEASGESTSGGLVRRSVTDSDGEDNQGIEGGAEAKDADAKDSGPALKRMVSLPSQDLVREDSVELVRVIGSGAYAKVWLAQLEGQAVAVKQISSVSGLADSSGDAQNISSTKKSPEELLEKEVGMLRRFSHPNIVQYIGVFNTHEWTDGMLYNIVMEYVPGGDLDTLLVRAGALSEKAAAGFAHQVLSGLEYLHANKVIHRDLKPANLLLDASGGGSLPRVKISDFGVSAYVSGAEVTKRSCVGTPWYLAPEVVKVQPYSYSADIWSLGSVVYAMVMGKKPYDNLAPIPALFKIAKEGPPELDSTLSRGCSNLIGMCWNTDPTKRPSASTALKHPWLRIRPQ